MTTRTHRRPALALLPLALSMIYATQAMAQTRDDTQVVEITATKRVEKIKDVPLSITAISGQALEDRGIEGPAALTGVIPNLNMAPAPVSNLVAAVGMRGIASGQPAIWADPSVGIYMDGVFVGKNLGALTDVVDIARLEALRGPQGTLFGRNTEAGAINFVTRKPSGVFGGAVSLEAGNYGRQVGRVSLDLPKMGILSASVAMRTEKQDGFIANPNGDAWGGKDRQAGRVALRLEPTKGLTIDYAYDKTKIDEPIAAGSLVFSTGYGAAYSPATTQIGGNYFAFQNPTCLQKNAAGVCVFPSPGIGPALAPFANPNYPTSVAASTQFGPQFQRLDVEGHALTVEYKINANNTLKYIGAQRDTHNTDNADFDGTPLLIFEALRTVEYKTTSHELQWIGSNGGMRYVAGVYLFDDAGSSLSNQAGGFFNFHPNVPGYKAAAFDIATNAKAVFGQLDFDAGPVSVGVGGRYTKESRSVRSWKYNTNSTFVQQGALTQDLSGAAEFSQFTPTFNLLYRLSSDTNIFARVARGFKSGGFPADAPITPAGCTTSCTSAPNKPFSPETSTAYELGMKTSVLGGKGQISANLFLADVKNYQVSLLPAGSISPTIVNAGKLRTQGFELDAALNPMDGTRLNVGYGYTDAKFKEYNVLSASNAPVDAASNTVAAGAPKHTLSLTLDQRLMRTGSGMSLRGLLDYRYVAERYTYPGQINATAANATVGNTAAESLNPALSLLDLRLILGGIKLGGPGEAELSLWVKNATNERKKVGHIDVSGFYQLAYWNDPRSYGATFNYRW